MMGVTHACSGTTVWLAVYPALDRLTGLTPGQAVLGAALTAGGAMLPDLDQGGITRRGIIPKTYGAVIARTYGYPTAGLAWTIGRFAGGHRNGTHSLYGIAAFTAAAGICAGAGGWPLWVAVWLLLGCAVRAFDLAVPGHITTTAIGHTVLCGLLTWWIIHTGVGAAEILPWAAGLGCAVHIAGDCATPQRCPLGWPFSHRRYGWPLVGTDSRAEHLLVLPGLLAADVGLLWLLHAQLTV